MQSRQKSSKSLLEKLPAIWNCLTDDYELRKIQGKGSFGQVVKAIHKQNSKTVAIKYIVDAFDDINSVKRVYREIAILRRLSQMEENIFTIKLEDVIVPGKDGEVGHP